MATPAVAPPGEETPPDNPTPTVPISEGEEEEDASEPPLPIEQCPSTFPMKETSLLTMPKRVYVPSSRNCLWCQKFCLGVMFFECSVLFALVLVLGLFVFITIDLARAVPRDVPIQVASMGDELFALGDQTDGLFWFLQLSDLHLNAERNPLATMNFEYLVDNVIPILSPHFNVVTGDISDSRPETLTGVAFGFVPLEEDWVLYEDILEENLLLDPYYWVDVRGNHDTYSVDSFESEFNYYCSYSAFARLPFMCNHTSIADKPDHSHMNSAVSLGMGDTGVALHAAFDYPEDAEIDIPWATRLISAVTVPLTDSEIEQRLIVVEYDSPISVTYPDPVTSTPTTTSLSMPTSLLGIDLSGSLWSPFSYFAISDAGIIDNIGRILPNVRVDMETPCADLAVLIDDPSLSDACPSPLLMSFSHFTISFMSNPDTLLKPLLASGVTTHLGGHMHTPMATGSRLDTTVDEYKAPYLYDRLAPDLKRHGSIVLSAVDRGLLSTVELTLENNMAASNNSWDEDYESTQISFQWPVVLCTSPKHASYLHDLEPNHLVT
ncbi:hypothetical protein KIPB_004041, partial [Kipferlia bialata]|eukprot:g4041.t1